MNGGEPLSGVVSQSRVKETKSGTQRRARRVNKPCYMTEAVKSGNTGDKV